jgi:hypothetical protein
MANRKISELNSITPTLSGEIPIVISGTTYKTSIESIRDFLNVDTTIEGDLTVSGDIEASFFIGDGSQLTNLPPQSIELSESPPSNNDLLWYDTNEGVNTIKRFDQQSLSWVPITQETIIKKINGGNALGNNFHESER